MRPDRSILQLFAFTAVFLLLLLLVTPQSSVEALQNKPREAQDMRGGGITDDDLTDYHDHYHDHSHDEHNFDEEGHKHVHWEL